MSLCMSLGLSSSASEGSVSTLNAEISRLASLEKSVFLAGFDSVAKQSDENALIPWARAFLQRLPEFSDAELVDIALSDQYDNMTRITAVQLYGTHRHTYKGKDVRLQAALKNETIPESVRSSIIVHLDLSDEEGLTLLEQVVRDFDDLSAFHALKQLTRLAPERAVPIARDILRNYAGHSEYKVRAAIRSMASQFEGIGENPILSAEESTDKALLFSVCGGVLSGSASDMAKLTAAIALRDAGTEEAKVLIRASTLDDDSKRLFAGDEAETRASGYQGYAVYRDGVLGGFDWHAAIVNSTSSTSAVAHARGNNYTTEIASWATFMGNNNVFKGVYRPRTQTLTNSERDAVRNTAYTLAVCQIEYSAIGLMSYNASGSVVQPSEISEIRCDGVVEYAYEYNDIRVYGIDSLWNISTNSSSVLAHHNSTLTPQEQAQYYMTQITSVEPF